MCLLKRAKTKLAYLSWLGTYTLAWHGTSVWLNILVQLVWYGTISCPAWLLRLFPNNIGVISALTLLLSCYGKGNTSLRMGKQSLGNSDA